MFRILILLLVFGIGCTKKSEPPAEPPQNTEVSQTESKPSEKSEDYDLPFPKTEGIELISDTKPSKTASFYSFDGLIIKEAKSGKVLDEFKEFVWGPTSTKISNNEVNVYFTDTGSEIEIKYQAKKDGRVERTTSCHMYDDPAAKSLYEKTLPKIDDPKAKWDTVVFKLSNLARKGNTRAFNFFMNPDSSQKPYQKYNDGAASFRPTQEILTFMKNIGCKWKPLKKIGLDFSKIVKAPPAFIAQSSSDSPQLIWRFFL